MFNLFRGEFYKLRKAKSMYICCMAAVAFIILLYGSLTLISKIMNEELENGTMGVMVMGNMTLADGEENIFDEIGILESLQQIFGAGFSAIIVSIFTCIFVLSEYANGAVKNIVGKGYSRAKLFLVKYITIDLAAIGMMIFMTVVTVLLGIIFVGTNGINAEFFRNLGIYTGIQILLSLGLNGIIIAISECIRNTAGGISISICLILFSSLITSGVDLLFHKTNFKVSDFWVQDLIGNCPTSGFESGYVLRAVIVAIVWIAVSFAIGFLHFRRADV